MAIADLPRVLVERLTNAGHKPTKREVQQVRRRSALWELKHAQSDEGVLAAAEKLFLLAARAREPFAREWMDYYRWARGQQWDERRPSWRSRAQSNYIFVDIHSRTALMSDGRPILRAIPRRPEQRLLTKFWVNPFLSYQWEKDGMDASYIETMAGMCITGTYFWKPFWDPSMDRGKGDLRTDRVEPFYIYPDPGAGDCQDGEFMFHAEPKALEQLYRQFPIGGDRVLPESIHWDFQGFRQRASGHQGAEMIPVDRKPAYRFWGSPASQTDSPPWVDIDRALAVELYVKDDDFRTITQRNGQPRYLQPHPKIRRIVFANGVLLEDEKFDATMFPLARVRDYMWPEMFWGGGEVEQLKDLQNEMNLMRARTSDHFKYFSNGVWIVDNEAMVLDDELSNEPGSVIHKNKAGEVKRETPPGLQSGALEYATLLQRDHENIAGNNEVNPRREPENMRSGKAVELVLEAAQHRIRLTEKMVKESLEDLGDLWLDVASRGYKKSGAKVVRITGEAGSPTIFRKLTPQMLEGKYDFEAAVGSQILQGRQYISISDGIALFAAGAIDQEALLSSVNFPEYRHIIQRMQEQGINAAPAGNDPAAQGPQGAAQGPLGVVAGGAPG